MWRQLSLSNKLLILLVAVQAIVLSLGFIVLLQWMKSQRMQDLYNQLDLQSDTLEDLISVKNHTWVYNSTSEVGREIFHDPLYYFLLQDSERKMVLESAGQSTDSRSQLREKLSSLSVPAEDFSIQKINEKIWIFQRTDILLIDNGIPNKGFLYVGYDINNAFDELKTLQHLAFTIITLALLLTATFSYFVINFSMRNLKKFSYGIQKLKPPAFLSQEIFLPHSAEEKLLFESYDTMVKAIRTTLENHRLFLANASHELKTPIAAALSAVEVTLSKPRDIKDYVDTCKDVMIELQVLKRLSHSLLNLAQLEENEIPASTNCNIEDILNGVVSRWSKIAQKKGIHFNYQNETIGINDIKGDTETWEIIFGNFFENAIKYGKHGGNIWLRVYKADQEKFEISISDDGIGMTLDEINQLGRVFFKADQSRSEVNSFGLGFALAKKLLERIGGELSVKQRNRGGIEIVLSLKT